MGYGFDSWPGSEDPIYLTAKTPEHKQQKQYCNKFNKEFNKKEFLWSQDAYFIKDNSNFQDFLLSG